jgi:predicted peptidase
MLKLWIGIASVLLMLSCGGRGVSESEFPSRSVTVNGHEYKFRIYVPPNRPAGEKTAVMLYLHGSGARGDDNQAQLEGMQFYVRQNPERYNFIIVFPQCRPEAFWAGEMLDQAMAALDQTVREFNADPNRLYLAGWSMGGFGTWQAAVAYPNKFAALVPIAGGIKPQGRVPEEQMAMLAPTVRRAAESDDPYKAFAEAIGSTPVWVFHGAADDIVSPEGSRQMVATLRANGNPNVRYTEFENVGHGSVANAFNEPELSNWLAKQSLANR